MERPPFPVGEKPSVAEVADWCELVTLLGPEEFKRGDLKSVISQENIAAPDRLEESVWSALQDRSQLYAGAWPILMLGQRLRRRLSRGDNYSLYRYLCLLGLGQLDMADRRLFEELVEQVLKFRLGGANAIRIGHPASGSMSSSFKVRVTHYAQVATLSEHEILSPPYAHDKDLGLDVVGWIPSRDKRGGYPHFLVQCATGRDWAEKFNDINFEVLQPHIYYAVKPMRVFCVPHVIQCAPDKWVRYSRQAGWIIDRPRLMEFSHGLVLSSALRSRLLDRIEELSAV